MFETAFLDKLDHYLTDDIYLEIIVSTYQRGNSITKNKLSFDKI